MKINDKGLTLIMASEGLRLTAYQDETGVWTIGYGHTKTAKPGMKITPDEATELLRGDVRSKETCVESNLRRAATENQFAAMVSLTFNIGCAAFAKSSVLRRFNRGDVNGAADAFLMWDKITVNGKLRSSRGLMNRRLKERDLFLTR